MGSSKPKPIRTPFEQNQTQTNTYAPISAANTPEAQAYLNQELDFGSDVNVDPGVGRRTDLAAQEAENRSNSAFNMGVPRIIREAGLAREQREIRGQGAAEAQQAEYINQIANNQRRQDLSMFKSQRLRQLLPQIYQTGGSGMSSGYGTQIVQPQPGFWQRAALAGIGGASTALRMGAGGE